MAIQTQPQTGLLNLQRNLTLGSSGPDVKILQEYLNGLNPSGQQLKTDGIYGPNTRAAVASFQAAHNLKPDGIVGPKTTQVLNTIQTQDVQSNTEGNTLIKPTWATDEDWNAANDVQKATLKALDAMVQSNKLQGYQINPNLTIDEKTAQKFMEQAKTKLAPVYREQIDNALSEARRSAAETTADYENTMQNAETAFTKNLGQNREAWAGSGLAFSGQRGLGEQQMLEAENRSRNYADLAYGNKLGDIARTTEKNVGASNMGGFRLPSSVSKRANLGGVTGGFDITGNMQSAYRPGEYNYGVIPSNEEQATNVLGTSLIENAEKKLAQAPGQPVKPTFSSLIKK